MDEVSPRAFQKSIFLNLMSINADKSHPDLTIAHFAGTGGNNASHYYAIYKILIRLRVYWFLEVI